MRHWLILPAVWLALATAAHASSLQSDRITGPVSVSGTATATTSANAKPNQLLIAACGDADGSSMTPNQAGWTSVKTIAATTWAGIWSRTVSNSEPGSYTWTATNTHHVSCTLIYRRSSDGTTPVIEASASTSSASTLTLAPAPATTLTANDVIMWITVGSWGFSTSTQSAPAAVTILGSPTFLAINAAEVLQESTGASITPTLTFNGTGAMDIATLAIKNNTTTAVGLVGVGNESYIASSTTNVTPGIPSNAASATTDTLLAFLSGYGGAVTLGNGLTNGTYSGTGVTYGAATLVNTDPETAVTFDGSTGTVTASSPVSLQQTPQTLECWFKFSGTPHGGLLKTGDSSHGWGVGIGTGNWDTAGTTLLGLKETIVWVTFTGIPTLVAGTTYHLVAENDNSNFFVWLNGTKYTGSASGGVVPSGGISVGSDANTGTRFLAATMQKAAFYQYELTASQIANHRLAGTTAPSGYAGAGVVGGANYDQVIQNDGPVIYYPLSQSSGTTATDVGKSGWTVQAPSFADSGASASMAVLSRVKTSTDPANWTFSFSASHSKAAAIIADFDNLNTSTPIDGTPGTLAMPVGLDYPWFPVMTPTSADELIVKASTAVNSSQSSLLYPTSTIYIGRSSSLGIGYTDVGFAGATNTSSGSTVITPFASVALGLDAATTPTTTSANARINQDFLSAFTTSAMTPQADTGLWTPAYFN